MYPLSREREGREDEEEEEEGEGEEERKKRGEWSCSVRGQRRSSRIQRGGQRRLTESKAQREREGCFAREEKRVAMATIDAL